MLKADGGASVQRNVQADSSSGSSAASNAKEQKNPELEGNAKKGPEKDWYDKAPVWINGILALVGAVGVGIGLFNMLDTHKIAEIARATQVAQFRPRVEIRQVSFSRDPSADTLESSCLPLGVYIDLINRGGTDAKLESFKASFQWLNPSSNNLGHIESSEKTTLRSGERHRVVLLVDGEKIPDVCMALVQLSRNRLYSTTLLSCKGTLCYADDNGARKETGFCRYWDANNDHFIASGDPEQEYVD